MGQRQRDGFRRRTRGGHHSAGHVINLTFSNVAFARTICIAAPTMRREPQ